MKFAKKRIVSTYKQLQKYQKFVAVKSFTSNSTSSYAVIHVGPHKTASTTLQKIIWNGLANLFHDNYFVPTEKLLPGVQKRIKTHANLAFCLQKLSYCNVSLWSSFKHRSHVMAKMGKNILISSEELSQENVDIKKLYDILKPWKHVKIVVIYRRFYEWLPSIYFETNKNNACKTKIPTFAEWLTNQTVAHFSKIYTTSVIHRYQKFFEDVVVLNYHDRNFLENFFCNTTPDAFHVCNGMKKSSFLSNRKSSLTYQIMAFEAFEKGLIRGENNSTICNHYAHATKERTENESNLTEAEFPQHCISQSMIGKIFMMTLEAEELVARKFFNTTVDKSALFTQMKHFTNRTYCSANITKILEEKSWQDFFDSFAQHNPDKY